MQGCVVLLCLVMSQLTADQDLFYVALIGLLIAIASATQDIAIDGFALTVLPKTTERHVSRVFSSHRWLVDRLWRAWCYPRSSWLT